MRALCTTQSCFVAQSFGGPQAVAPDFDRLVAILLLDDKTCGNTQLLERTNLFVL